MGHIGAGERYFQLETHIEICRKDLIWILLIQSFGQPLFDFENSALSVNLEDCIHEKSGTVASG
jgi:hypothetical protein